MGGEGGGRRAGGKEGGGYWGCAHGGTCVRKGVYPGTHIRYGVQLTTTEPVVIVTGSPVHAGYTTCCGGQIVQE